AFALERRPWSFREQWRRLRRECAATLGLGAAVFVMMMVPLVGLLLLPTAAVAGDWLVLDDVARGPRPGPAACHTAISLLWSDPRLVHSLTSVIRGGYAGD